MWFFWMPRVSNLADIERFLRRAADRIGVAKALKDGGYSPEDFVTALSEKSAGVWIYLSFVVDEIDRGERSPLDLAILPHGLTEYYAQYWQRWRNADETQWYKSYLKLLATLAAAQEAIDVGRLATWAKVEMPVQSLRRLLDERWRPFLSIIEEVDGEIYYRFFHSTLREFFHGRAERDNPVGSEILPRKELAEATRGTRHWRILQHYLGAWGGLEESLSNLADKEQRDLDEGYGLRYAVLHMIEAGLEGWKLPLFVAQTSSGRSAWYQAHEQAGDITGYLVDIERAWQSTDRALLAARSPHDRAGLLGRADVLCSLQVQCQRLGRETFLLISCWLWWRMRSGHLPTVWLMPHACLTQSNGVRLLSD